MRKSIVVDERAEREIEQFPETVQEKLAARLAVLSRDGFLQEPYGKRLTGDLFEIRIKYRGQWRVIYAYLEKNSIVILSAFHKKTQQTPSKELKRALNRLRQRK